jgi:glycosyltransferase involved in cell wall biosynthesis
MDINYIGPINFLGYGVASTNIFKALKSIGNNLNLFCIGPLECKPEERSIFAEAQSAAELYFPTAPSLKVWHQYDLGMQVGKGLHCAFPIFELDGFRQVEKHHLNNQDIIYVASQWAKQVLANNDISTKCVVAPFGVNTNIFRPEAVPRDSKSTVFINIGKWEIRKGHDILLDAFNKAFAPSDDVHLIMHCYNPFLIDQRTGDDGNLDWRNMYMNSKMGKAGHITIKSGRVSSQEELAFLINQTDCGIFPSRAEGWNLPLMEMMACGKMVITTNYSAHTEFCTNDNSLLIPIDKLELADDRKWFKKQGSWAKIGKEQVNLLIEYMRKAHKDKQENVEGIKTAKRFTWKNTAEKIVGAFDV